MTTDMFFSLLKRKAATERPFEVWGGSLGLGRGGGGEEKLFWEAQLKNVSQIDALGNFWCDLE